jgi:hypothetical protein
MSTIDQLLNDIDEFETWPLDTTDAAATDAGSSVAAAGNAYRDLVEDVLHSFDE